MWSEESAQRVGWTSVRDPYRSGARRRARWLSVRCSRVRGGLGDVASSRSGIRGACQLSRWPHSRAARTVSVRSTFARAKRC